MRNARACKESITHVKLLVTFPGSFEITCSLPFWLFPGPQHQTKGSERRFEVFRLFRLENVNTQQDKGDQKRKSVATGKQWKNPS